MEADDGEEQEGGDTIEPPIEALLESAAEGDAVPGDGDGEEAAITQELDGLLAEAEAMGEDLEDAEALTRAAEEENLRAQAQAWEQAAEVGVEMGEEEAAAVPAEEDAAEEEGEGEVPEDEEDEGPPERPGSVQAQAPKKERREDEDSDLEEIDEDLKDAVEGTFRLKRLLSREYGEEDEKTKKKVKTDLGSRSAAEDVKVSQLLNKWGLQSDSLTRHVLESLTLQELQYLITSNYSPDTHNMWKSPAELLQTHTNQVRESKGPGGGPLDVVSAFRFRYRLDIHADKLLRSLCHKDLRYVLRVYDGTVPLDQVVAAAKAYQPPDEEISTAAVPEAPGVIGMGRYTRLELIDPMADCAVFGDANLTFAHNLARHRKALGHVGRVIATTFETLETLQERYKEIDETIAKLEEHFAEVHHGVDCTRIAIDDRFNGLKGKLGAVYYNYPHAGAVGGFFDGHPVVNWRHENLMRLFFRALRSFVKPGGQVKVASNAGAVGVRFSYIVSSATQNEFEHAETMPFQQWSLHRYGRSYGDRRDVYKRPGEGEQYNAQRADSDMVYCFVYKPSGRTLPRQQIRLPPTYKTMLGCTDGALGERQGESKKKLANELFKRFMQECSGVHVG